MPVEKENVLLYSAAMETLGSLSATPVNSSDLNVPRTSDYRVLVIGASADYIDFIYRHYPGRAVFVTDPSERIRGEEAAPDRQSEILVAMKDPHIVLERILRHIKRYGLRTSGVTCFDCESLYLSSLIATELALPYPSPEAVLASRSKFLSKSRWQRAGLDCPAAIQVSCLEEIVAFLRQHGGKIIIKPLTGSGSELLFICSTAEECAVALATMTGHLATTAEERMYSPYEADDLMIDPRRQFVAEEYREGTEYSCDFFIEGDTVLIIRITRKWLKTDPAPGTVLAYQVPAGLPIDPSRLREKLRSAANTLGIDRGLCMLDFLMAGDQVVLLELSPRPGGDCLPQLLRASCGMDIFGLTLDVAESLPVQTPNCHQWQPLVGLRLFAPQPGGTVALLNAEELARDPRVLEMKLTRKPGQLVIHPPDAYQSRIMGYALFRPFSGDTVERECYELLDKLIVTYNDQGLT